MKSGKRGTKKFTTCRYFSGYPFTPCAPRQGPTKACEAPAPILSVSRKHPSMRTVSPTKSDIFNINILKTGPVAIPGSWLNICHWLNLCGNFRWSIRSDSYCGFRTTRAAQSGSAQPSPASDGNPSPVMSTVTKCVLLRFVKYSTMGYNGIQWDIP
jgi:hypothetical protein